MSRKTVEILGVNIDSMTFDGAVETAQGLLSTDGVSTIFTPNPEIIMCAKEDSLMKEILNSADICTADGIGVVYASKILKKPVPERVAGFDLVCALLERMAETKEGVFLFGAKPGVADVAKAKMEEKYPGINIVGTQHGYFSPEGEEDIVKKINESGAKLLLVCLGAPKQEKWIAKHKEKLNVNLAMGVGGTLDVFAGVAKRAPEIFVKLNLEWAYRILKNPSRLGRFAALPKFAFEVLKENTGKNYKQ
ncbi:MAG: WecB/TagA/CpsF family glycosyltransferase [Clostridia bacterium]|nr:WecB/TagA/CpsF family glycosyltransferase [Clostridia bacterium]